MTTAGGEAGGSGMSYGDSTVAARLSIDIPTEGVQSLREITQEISRFRTEMEAASRSEGDFIGFFQTLPSIASQAANAYKTFADQLERSLAMQQRMSGAVGQWDVQPGSTPDPFKGMSAGMGRSGKDINQTVADMDRMREMGSAGERQYMNIRQQRGATRPGDIPSLNSDNDIAASNERISTRERVNQERSAGPGGGMVAGAVGGALSGSMGGIAKEIMNEFSVGGGRSGGISGILQRGINSAAEKYAQYGPGGAGGGGGMGPPPHTSGAVPSPASGSSGAVGSSGGGPGGILGMLGRGGFAGGALGLAGLGMAGFEATQFAGTRLQNLRQMGLVEGGGVKEGAEQEVQARIMALNPFITNDQSRSIIQSALRDGYTGKEYETVTQFMKDNLVDFGLSVQQSRDMIKKDMVEGGSTSAALGAELEKEKQLSKTGYLKQPDRVAAAANLRGIMEDAGASGSTAISSAGAITDMYSDDQMLKGTMADGFANIESNRNLQAMALQWAGIAPDSDYGNWGDQLAQVGPEAVNNIAVKVAQMVGGKSGPFMDTMNKMGFNLNQAQAKELLRRVKGGGNEAGRARQRNGQVDSTEDSVQQRSGLDSSIGSGSRFGALGGTLADVFSGNWSNIPQRWRGDDFNETSEHIPILDKLVESQGGDPNKILVQDDSGDWNKLQPGNQDQLSALAKGGKWKREGDDQGYTLGQTGSAMNSNFGKQQVEVGGSVQITVSAEPGTKVTSSPNVIKLTQNQMNANAGYGNYTMNSPAPGDR